MTDGRITPFTPTHRIIFTPSAPNAAPETYLVALDPDRDGDGPAYTREEWDADAPADWNREGGAWHWRDACAPGGAPGEVVIQPLDDELYCEHCGRPLTPAEADAAIPVDGEMWCATCAATGWPDATVSPAIAADRACGIPVRVTP